MQLSVIVPVYNAGELLAPCLRSLLTLPAEKEVIVVDDGSTDGAIDALPDDIRQQIRLIGQRNQGVSAARNAGLMVATGKWIWFADADDLVVMPDSAGIDFAALANAEFVTLPFIWEENGRCQTYAAHDGEIPYNLWRCWFRRTDIGSLRFTVGRRYGEDQEFILRYLLVTDATAAALANPTYHYTMRATGAMRKAGTKWRQRRDVTAVLTGFVANALVRGKLTRKWVIHEIKRLIKHLIVIS